MKRILLISTLATLVFCFHSSAAESDAPSAALLKDHGLPAGGPEQALPQHAIVHLQINKPQRLLENLERLIVSTVPEKLLPADAQQLLQMDHPILTLLGMHTIQAPLTADAIAENIGLAADRPASLTLYPGVPPKSLVLTIPIANHARFEQALRSSLKSLKYEGGSLGDKPFVRIELNHPQCKELFVACSSDRAFITGEQSLLLLAYADSSTPRLKESHHFAEVIECTAREDIWLTFDPALVKPLLAGIELFKYMPLKLLSEKRSGLLSQIPAQQREMLEKRLRIQFGIKSLEQFADYAECVLSATYEEVFDFAISSVKSFHGVTLALKLDGTSKQATAYLHSDEFQAGAGTKPIPLDSVRAALGRIPGPHQHVTITGQQPKVDPSIYVTSWLKRVRTGFEAKNLNLFVVEALEALHRNTMRPQPIASQVPWTVTTHVAVNSPPAPEETASLQDYVRALQSLGSYPAARMVTVVPDRTGDILEKWLVAERDAVIHNRALVKKTFEGEASSESFLDRAFRLNRRSLDANVQELTWESSFFTRGGFFGFNQHELVNRRIYYSRSLGDYTVFHRASKDPAWISGLQLHEASRISSGLAKLLERVPEGANHVRIYRMLASVPGMVQWVQAMEDLVHRDAEDYLVRVRRIADETDDPTELIRKLESVKFSPVVASVNRDSDSGEIYCLLPGNAAFPRPKVGPALEKLFGSFKQYADDLGGGLFYTRVSGRRYEVSFVQKFDAISKLIKTVGNTAHAEYLENGEKKAALEHLLVTDRDQDPDRIKEILLRNPTWEALAQVKIGGRRSEPELQTEVKQP